MCNTCPTNSNSTTTGSTTCDCNAGYTNLDVYNSNLARSCYNTQCDTKSTRTCSDPSVTANLNTPPACLVSNINDGIVSNLALFFTTDAPDTSNQWLSIDFEQIVSVNNVSMWFHTGALATDWANYAIYLSNDSSTNQPWQNSVWSTDTSYQYCVKSASIATPGSYSVSPWTVTCTTVNSGRYLFIVLPWWANRMFRLLEVQVSGYKKSNNCIACAAGTYKNTTGSAACTNNLLCNAGYTSRNGGPCFQCDAGKYKTTTNTLECSACPANSGASCSGCTALASCTCNPGFYGPNGGTCTACPANSGESCSGCTALASCKCNAGRYGPNGGTCTACPANSGASCSGCTALASCTCNPGFTGPSGGVCTACTAGKYKITTGTLACTSCGTGMYSPTVGATSVETCIACPTGSGSTCVSCSAITNCNCNVGYTRLAGTCTACDAGKYKIVTGSAVCTDCVAGKYSTTLAATVATTCLGCPTSSTSPLASSAPAACTCNAGFTGPDGGTCTYCAAGTYKSVTGSTPCTSCPANSGASCIACDSALQCTCNAGYVGPDGGPCTACAAGTYSSVVCIDTLAESTCYNLFAEDLCGGYCESCCATCQNMNGCNLPSPTCVSCPAGATSPVGSTSSAACIVADCNAGYTGPSGGPCAACVAGTYKSAAGSAACTNCGVGTYSSTEAATSAATCLTCPANSGASCSGCSASACPCNSGYVNTSNFIVQYSSTACARFVALMTWKPSFASVSTRNNAAVGSSPLPTYNALGGPNGNGHVSFDRALLQYLDAGACTFNTATNGGFTIVAVLRFSGTSIKTETILEIPNRVSLYSNSRTAMRFFLSSGGGNNVGSVIATFSPGTNWFYIVCTYSSVTNAMNVLIDNVNQGTSTTFSPHVPDITLTNMYIGKADATVPSFNGDIAGLFVVDELLGSSAIAEIYNKMLQGVDLTETPCSGATCAACVAGKYQIDASSTVCTPCAAGTYSPTAAATSAAACLACPANSNSPAGSTAAASCVCNLGFAFSGGACVCDLGYEPGAV